MKRRKKWKIEYPNVMTTIEKHKGREVSGFKNVPCISPVNIASACSDTPPANRHTNSK